MILEIGTVTCRENPYEIASWLCSVFTGTSVHVIISKTIIITLEGILGRKANHQEGMEKHKLLTFAQILLQMRVEKH